MGVPSTEPEPMSDHSPREWQRLVEAAGPASLLVVIESRMSAALRRRLTPEDILQESLLQAWRDRNGARFDTARAFRCWLLTIIDHRIRDAADGAGSLKRGGNAVVQTLASPSTPELDPCGSTTPSRLAVHREQAAAMREALLGVPEEWREVVRLRLFQQMSLQQICDDLGLSLAVVRKNLRRGAEVYRQRLRAAGIGRSTIQAARLSSDGRAMEGTDPASYVV